MSCSAWLCAWIDVRVRFGRRLEQRIRVVTKPQRRATTHGKDAGIVVKMGVRVGLGMRVRALGCE